MTTQITWKLLTLADWVMKCFFKYLMNDQEIIRNKKIYGMSFQINTGLRDKLGKLLRDSASVNKLLCTCNNVTHKSQ